MNFLANTPIASLLSGNFKDFILNLLYFLPALIIAISFHEFAHAWMANKMGDPTAKNLGRMTLDPTKHFDIWGFVMLILVGFGWGKPVPTNSRNYYNYKKGNALVALAGVTMNLILSFIFFAIIYFVFNNDFKAAGLLASANGIDTKYTFLILISMTNNIFIKILGQIVILNIFLCFFNLIPIPPLDGHHLIKGWIARRSPNFYMMYQKYGFFVLIGIMVMTDWINIALSFISSLVLYVYSLFFGLFL